MNDLRIWRADVSVKSAAGLMAEGQSAYIYISEATLNRMAADSPETYLLDIDVLQTNLKNQLYFAIPDPSTVLIACGAVIEGELKYVVYLFNKVDGRLMFQREIEPPVGAEWTLMKVYKRERDWDKRRVIKRHPNKIRVRP